MGKFEEHENKVNSVASVNDTKLFISGSSDHTVKVWNFGSKESIFTLEGHNSAVKYVASIPKCNLIVSASFIGEIIVWDYIEGSIDHYLSN